MENHRIPFSGQDNHLKLSLNQNFESIEILSLKVDMEDIYPLISADYGCVVGRITTNNGFGISNVKISIFIPTVETDSNLKSIYPYVNPFTKNGKTRYNLLPNTQQSEFHTPVGTFVSKNTLLDNPTELNIFEKYYTYTTTTNESGDFLLMGVPVGLQQLHLDCDLSDIGYFSVRPYDMIAAGYSEKLFVNHVKYKGGENLDNLAQIITLNTTVNVLPFWGDDSINEVGFTKFQYDIPYSITPHAIVFGSLYSDDNSGRIKRNCTPTSKSGLNCNLTPINGNIEVLSRNEINENNILSINNSDIDDNGNFILLIPMNNKKVITDENGSLIPSLNNDGIPTESKIRLRISNYDINYSFWRGSSRTASYLIPNLYNRFDFDENTNNEDFFTVQWKKYYTVSQYIPRFQNNTNDESKNFFGFSNIGECANVNPLPYNRLDKNLNPLYTIFYVITNVIVIMCKVIAFLGRNPVLKCGRSDIEYSSASEYEQWQECVMAQFAEEIGVIKYQFFNDWINGSVYFPKLSYKQKRRNNTIIKERYCDYNCRELANTNIDEPNYYNKCRNSFIVDKSTFYNGNNYVRNMGINSHGLILKKDDFLYYASRWDNNNTNLSVFDKSKLLLATNLVELGSVEKNDFHQKPQIIKKFTSTTYNSPEGSDTLFHLTALDVNHIHSNGISLNSQINIDMLTEEDDLIYVGNFSNLPDVGYDINSNNNRFSAFDRTDINLRKYLCENFKYYDSIFTYQNSTVDENDSTHIVNDDNTVYEIDIDKCLGCEDKNTPAERIHPYYFYFGTIPNKTVIDLIKKKYV